MRLSQVILLKKHVSRSKSISVEFGKRLTSSTASGPPVSPAGSGISGSDNASHCHSIPSVSLRYPKGKVVRKRKTRQKINLIHRKRSPCLACGLGHLGV